MLVLLTLEFLCRKNKCKCQYVIEKIRKCSCVSRSIPFCVTSLDPKVIIHEPTCGYNCMNKLIKALHEANQISGNVSGKAKQHYRNFNLKRDFDNFEAMYLWMGRCCSLLEQLEIGKLKEEKRLWRMELEEVEEKIEIKFLHYKKL
ncbi:hypothetical protein PR048_011545 [Dryococelus australis]|uniref:Uncharacterized protein n=1 Tax=Dryococelus australis TaxID=614101 RepID=A0ABQ9HLW5_9NEOP|nr:hypothetical protein PR048_011545 [Dryococelus australis]